MKNGNVKTGKIIITLLLLLSSVLTAAGEDAVRQRGCRRPGAQARSLWQQQPSLARKAHSLRRATPGSHYIGERHQLTVLASFADQSFAQEDPVPTWERILNAHDYTEEPFYGSVHDYFYSQSYGQFDVTFDIVHIPLASARSRYRSTRADDENSQFLVIDLAEQLQTLNIDWSLYDWDADGYVDQLLVIYAGKGSSYGGFGGGTDAIWPHQYWLSKHIDTATQDFCQPYTVTDAYGVDYKIDSYCAVNELYRDDSYGSFGTICHEYSHCFGFPDFYYGSGTSVVDEWDLMDYGNNNRGGFCPPGYSAHERWFMGWLTLTELSEPATVAAMPALGTASQAYLIRNDARPDEYYVVENRQQQGWDQSLPGSGLVVFHVDYDYDLWTGYQEAINSSSRKRYSIVPANNRTSTSYSYGWAYPYDDNDQLTDTSTPAATLLYANTSGDRLMGKPLTRISLTDGLASFDFMGGHTAVRPIFSAAPLTAPRVLYSLGPVSIVRLANGEIKKVKR